MNTLLRDIRFGARALARSWGFSVVAILILALGIGATATVFSVTNAMLFRPLNSGATHGLVRLYSRGRGGEGGYRRFSYPNYLDLGGHRELFAGLAAYDYDFVGVTEGTTTRRVFAGFVSSSFFPLLGVPMAKGRAFTPDDDQPGSPPVVIVSHDYWVNAGADPAFVGRTLTVSGRPCTVVGVTPPGFTGTMAVTAPPLWLPLGQTGGRTAGRSPGEQLRDRNSHRYGVVGRLAAGLTPASAAPGLEVLSRRLEQAWPAENRNQLIQVRPAPRIGDSGSPKEPDPFAVVMSFVLAMAAAVLLVVALNLANMLLARGSLRQKEIAVRLAIGAGRWGIVRQLLVESSMLSAAGGVLGLCVAYGASRLLASTLLPVLPMFAIVFDPTPDMRVLLVTLGFAVLGTAVFGLGPALQLSRADVVTALKEVGGASPARPGAARSLARHGLVVGQIALSLALLTSGGLFLFGAIRATTADPGFSLDRGILATVDGTLAGYDAARSREAHLRVLDRLRSLTGVVSASFASTVPYGESSNDQPVQPAGAAPRDRGVGADYRVIGADYFRTLGVPIVRGRDFTEAEERAVEPASSVIVDVELARKLWPEGDPIGRQIQWAGAASAGSTSAPVTYEVVGVAGSIKASLFGRAPRPHVYVPYGGRRNLEMTMHVRTRAAGGEAEAGMLEAVGAAIRAADPGLPVVALKTLREHRDTGYEVWFVRLAAKVFAVFGVVALAVAMVGVFGVRAVMVGRRTREFGIRMAIGATAGDIVRLVLLEGGRLVVVGLVLGLLLSAALSRVLAGWIYGVRAFEPAVFLATSALLVAAMLVACYLPARRATAVQPMTALRDQ